MTRPLTAAGIEGRWCRACRRPFASAAAAGETLTLPEVTQTVILTRVAGRTPMPAGEDLTAPRRPPHDPVHLLSITLLHEVQRALRRRLAGGRADPGGPEGQLARRGEDRPRHLADIKRRCQAEKIASQAMIIASPTLAPPTGRPSPAPSLRPRLQPLFPQGHGARPGEPRMNDTAILLVGHGSCNRDGNAEILHFAARWRERHPAWRIETCFIEHAEVLLTPASTAPPGRPPGAGDPLHPQRRRPREDGTACRRRGRPRPPPGGELRLRPPPGMGREILKVLQASSTA